MGDRGKETGSYAFAAIGTESGGRGTANHQLAVGGTKALIQAEAEVL
jgi:hypothetical protein